MSLKHYYIGLVTICMSVMLTPEVEQFVRVYLITAVVFVTGAISLLFRWKQLREYIVKRIIADVMEELFTQKGLSDLQAMKKHVERRALSREHGAESSVTDTNSLPAPLLKREGSTEELPEFLKKKVV